MSKIRNREKVSGKKNFFLSSQTEKLFFENESVF
jgi:hypothetical protein